MKKGDLKDGNKVTWGSGTSYWVVTATKDEDFFYHLDPNTKTVSLHRYDDPTLRIYKDHIYEDTTEKQPAPKNRPQVGVGVMIFNDEGKILLLKRKGAHGAGTWSFPGGHLEFNEGIFECAERETLEEVGIYLKDLQMGPYTNDIFEEEGLHYITLYIIAIKHGHGFNPVIKEPDKASDIGWFELDKLPEPLFKNIPWVVQYVSGKLRTKNYTDMVERLVRHEPQYTKHIKLNQVHGSTEITANKIEREMNVNRLEGAHMVKGTNPIRNV